MKKCFASALALLSLCGCLAPQRNFDRIASRLDRGGTCYSVSDWSVVRKQTADFEGAFSRAVMDDERITQVQRREFFRRRTLASMAAEVAGINAIEGWGCSSVPRSAASAAFPGLYRNRLFVAMPTADSAMGCNAFFGENRDDFVRSLAGLPGNVGIVLWGNIRPSSLIRMLRSCGRAVEKLDGVMNFLTNFPLTDNDGEWLLAAAPYPGATFGSFANWRIKVELPDAEGKLFALLAVMLDASPRSDRVSAPAGAPGFAPVLIRRNGKLIAYNEPGAEKFFEHCAEKLIDSPRFRRITAELPDRGAFFGYIDAHCMPRGNLDFAGVEIPGNLVDESGCAVFSRENDGWLWIENSTADWNAQKFFFAINLIDIFAGDAVCDLLGISGEAAAAGNASANAASSDEPPEHRCVNGPLKRLSAALESFAAAHQGAYPASDGKAGLDELRRAGSISADDLHCADARSEFVYFGGLKREAGSTLPVVIDRGHAGCFNVIFSDGSIKQYALERADSLPRIVSFLYTQFHWDERVFGEMIRKAVKLDKSK